MERTSPAPTEYRVHARAVADGHAWADAQTGEIAFEARWGESVAHLPGPAELLAASLAGCLLKNLSRTRALLGFDYSEATVEVVARRQDDPPRFVGFTYTLRVVTDEPERRLELVHRNLRKFGTVYNTLAATCTVEGTVERVPTEALLHRF